MEPCILEFVQNNEINGLHYSVQLFGARRNHQGFTTGWQLLACPQEFTNALHGTWLRKRRIHSSSFKKVTVAW